VWGKQPFRLLATFRQFSQETVTLGARRKDVKSNKPIVQHSKALLGRTREEEAARQKRDARLVLQNRQLAGLDRISRQST